MRCCVLNIRIVLTCLKIILLKQGWGTGESRWPEPNLIMQKIHEIYQYTQYLVRGYHCHPVYFMKITWKLLKSS